MGRGIIVRSSDSQSRVHHAWCNFGQVTDLHNLPLYRIGVTLSRRIKEITPMEYGEQCRARSRASQMAPLPTIIAIVKVARAQESRKASLYPSIFSEIPRTGLIMTSEVMQPNRLRTFSL